MSRALAGIIANPASGRDIRRLVAHGTVFDNNEKTAIVRRVLLGLAAIGIKQVAYMPEHDFGIVPRAPISTGTNNVFPAFIEGTLAGLAAGLIVSGRVADEAVQRVPWLEVLIDGASRDYALVDVVASSLPFVGSRAIWDLSVVREVALARVAPATIGLSALGCALLNHQSDTDHLPGMHIALGDGGAQVLAALAPGLVRWVGIKTYRRLALDDRVQFQSGAGTLALDGEREIELSATTPVEVRLRADGPFVVNVDAALAAAAHAGHLSRQAR